ncbi:MAG: YkgJ family cysteine cluster protein [Zoogloeaceae bacterium]|jgi:Fe-S-cluster containining protein|nr:YkgJ family cysteine cluster protein [Zoogloeaceae bacterium]
MTEKITGDFAAANTEPENPCRSCGACCAAFCVDFHPVELAGGVYAWASGVPVNMTVPVTAAMVRMRGTDDFPPRCVALAGEVGQSVSCRIYASRPSPCREFYPAHAACDRARWRHGMLPCNRMPASP